jgi:outer membrane protein assembly factor BamD (BamD/ComL family)
MDYYTIVREFSKKAVVATAFLACLAITAGKVAYSAETPAQTWRLDDQGQWKAASGSKEEEFLLAVANLKKLADAGKPDKVKKAAKKLQTDFPQIAGADFNAFVDAEVLLAKGKLSKAVKEYDKLLDDYPKSTLRDAALEREFGIASDYLAGRKKQVLLVFFLSAIDEGVKIMDKISDREGASDLSKRASYAVVQSYESRREYNEAYLKWSEIQNRWPTGQTANEALLGMARNKYVAFRGPDYDGSCLVSAKSYYENYRLRYPQEAQQLGVDEILKRIDEQLAEKNLRIARYYSKTGGIGPANMYYQMVVDTWPNTSAAQTAKEKLNQK